jgi:predicted dehydrogenase
MFRFGILGTSHFAVTRMIPAIQAGHATAVVAIASRDRGQGFGGGARVGGGQGLRFL